MNLDALHSARHRRLPTLIVALSIAFGAAYAVPSAQSEAQAPATTKKALTVDDYTRWRSISGDTMSGDGKWVAYVLQLTNTAPADAKPVLHIRNLETDQEVEVANATGAEFSDDSQWIAYLVDPSGGRGGRGGRGRAAGAPAAQPEPSGRGEQTPAEPRRAELRNLSTGVVRSWQDIASFDFAASSAHLLLRRRPPQAAGR